VRYAYATNPCHITKEVNLLMKTKLGILLKTAAVAGAAALLLAGCSSSNSSSSGKATSNPYHLITPGTILAATSGDQPPFATMDASGNPSGMIIDVTDAVAKRLGLKVTYKLATTDAGIQGLSAKQYDMVANGLGVTPERQKAIDFAKGLYWSTTAMLTKKSSPATKLTDFSGKKVAVVTGSVQVDYFSKLPGAIETDYQDENSAVSALNSGSVDAFIVGGPDAEQYLKKFSSLKIAASAPVDHATTVAFQKGNSALTKAFDKEVGEMIDDGSFQKIYTSYFSEKPEPELVNIWPKLGDMK